MRDDLSWRGVAGLCGRREEEEEEEEEEEGGSSPDRFPEERGALPPPKTREAFRELINTDGIITRCIFKNVPFKSSLP